MLVWFHSFPKETEEITESQFFEQINLSVFEIASENSHAKKLFSGDFNEFIDFAAQESVYSEVEILLPATEVLLTNVSVPSKSKNRIMQALPFLLDDNLINNMEQQYFALGRISSSHSNIAVVAKYIFDTVYTQFKALSLPVSSITSELFKLPWFQDKWSFAFSGDKVLIRTGVQSGLTVNEHNLDFSFRVLLNNSFADEINDSEDDVSEGKRDQHNGKSGKPDSIVIYAQKNDENIAKISSIADEYGINIEVVNDSFFNLVTSADTLTINRQGADTINLLQGKFHAANFKRSKIPLLKSLAAVFSLWFVSQIFIMGYQWTSHNNELSQLELQLEELYFKTFPHSKRLIDVRLQTQNQLKQLKKKSASNSSFFSLLGQVGEEIRRNKDIKVNSLRYNDEVLQLDIVSKKFIFNKLKSILKNKHNLIVEERSSSMIDGEVRSVLNFKINKFNFR